MTSRQAMIRFVSIRGCKSFPESSGPPLRIFPDEIARQTNCLARPPRKTLRHTHIVPRLRSPLAPEYEWVKYTKEPEGIPRSSATDRRQLSEFQPTCGDLTPSGKRPHSPGNNPRPRIAGASALDSNIHCMPTQMPRNGTPRSIAVQNRGPQPGLFQNGGGRESDPPRAE